MISFRPTLPHDVDNIDVQNIYKGEGDIVGRTKRTIAGNFNRAHSWTFTNEHKEILAIMTGITLWDGVMRVFMLTSAVANVDGPQFLKLAGELIESYHKLYSIHRFEVHIKSDYLDGHRWASLLGFKAEAVLKQFGPDKSDYILFARCF